MTYDEARREVELGLIGGRYTRTQARRLRAAIRVLERYRTAIPIWSQFEALSETPDWADRVVKVSHVADPLHRARF